MLFPFSRICIVRNATIVALLSLFCVLPIYAQSTDVRFPTPVDGSEIVAAIVARDIGDARLTDHFYTFNGSPGDLLITIESRNLNGDFDVFTAAELRPILKVSVYAETSTAVTKNIYLRRSESLILRVEARTPNDDEGTYRIRFSGSFAPLDNRLLAADSGTRTEEGMSQPSRTGDRKTTRVSSSGARIEEPATEVATTPNPELTPATPAEESASPVAKTTTTRNSRIRRPTARVTTKKPPAKQTQSDPAAANEAAPEKTVVEPVKSTEDPDATSRPAEDRTANPDASATNKRPTPRGPAPRSRRGPAGNARPTAENGRLIIEVRDGSRIEYLMSTVTRLTVENGEIVIVSDDGYTKRVPLTNVLKMSIGP